MEAVSATHGESVSDQKIRISPRAKRMAENKGIRYLNLSGTGPNGRIISRDIENASSDNTGDCKNNTAIRSGVHRTTCQQCEKAHSKGNAFLSSKFSTANSSYER